MTNFFYFKPLAITLHVFVALCAVPAYSQTANSNTSDTVVVSAGVLKVDTALQETPQSVSVITQKELETRAPQKLDEALRYTSGVTAQP